MKKFLFFFLFFVSSLFSKEFDEIEFINQSLNPLDDFSRDNLLKLLGITYPPFYKFWQDDPTFDSNEIENYQNKLIGFTKSKGYFGADVKYLEDNTSTLKFEILKGEVTKIDKVEIDSDFDLPFDVNLTILDVGEFQNLKERISNTLINNGYAKHTLKTKAYVQDLNATLNIFIRKNDLNRFSKVIIDDIEGIDKNLILEQVEFKEGDVFSQNAIDSTYKNLTLLDIFQSIDIEQKETNSTFIPIHIALRKGKERAVKSYVGFNSNTAYLLKFNFIHKNFFGNLKVLDLDLIASGEGYESNNRLFIPKIYKKFSFEDLLSLSSKSYDGYDEDRISNSASLNREIFGIDSYFGLSTEQSKITSTSEEISSGSYFINSLFLKFQLDKRDNKLDPRNGYLFNIYLEDSSKLYKSEFEFLKFLGEFRFIHSIDKFIFANKLKVGFITSDVPTFKRFFAGGSFSNRGYEYRAVGDMDSYNNPIGGNSMVDYTFELQYEFYPNLYGAIFYDTTSLNRERFKFDGFYDSIGMGVRYKSIVGPIRFDVAKALDDEFAFHFSIGETF